VINQCSDNAINKINRYIERHWSNIAYLQQFFSCGV